MRHSNKRVDPNKGAGRNVFFYTYVIDKVNLLYVDPVSKWDELTSTSRGYIMLRRMSRSPLEKIE